MTASLSSRYNSKSKNLESQTINILENSTKSELPIVESKKSVPILTKSYGLSSVYGKHREEMKKELKSSIKPVSANTIRRHRIRYNEAICFELDESGFKNIADYIRKLISLNDEIRNYHGPDTWMWIQPQLKNSHDQLDLLSEELVNAEKASRAGEKLMETDIILKLAIHFMQMPEGWWWLAEQLLHEVIQVSDSLKSDGGRIHTVVRYIFGRFLFLQLKDHNAAIVPLKYVRENSLGRSWKATELGIPQEILYEETCILLAEIILIHCEEYRENDPLKAARTCSTALRRAKESRNPDIICKVYLQFGLFNLECNDANSALHNFQQYISESKKNKNNIGICKGLIHAALAYTKLGKAIEAETNLLNEIKIAKESDLQYYEGQGYRYAGEFYLNQNKPDISFQHFRKAFNILILIGTRDEQDEIRCLAGVAKGNNLMNNYSKLILCCGRHDKKMRNLSRLCQWKGHRDNFWENMNEQDLLNTSILRGSYESIVSITHIEDIVNTIIEDTLKLIIRAKPEKLENDEAIT